QPSSRELCFGQFATGTAQQLLDVLEVEGELLTFREASEQSPLEGQGQPGKVLQTEQLRLLHSSDEFPLHQRLPVFFLGSRQLRHAVEYLANVGVVLAFQQRQQLVAHPIAREAMVEVGFVLPPALAERGEIAFDLLSRDAKQRAYDTSLVAATRLTLSYQSTRGLRPGLNPSRRCAAWISPIGIAGAGGEAFVFRSLKAWIDSCQPARACAAQKLQQHGFRLIVQGVRRRDLIQLVRFGKRSQPAISQLPRRRFHAQLAGECMIVNIAAAGENLQVMLSRQLCDERLVSFRIFSS